MLLLRVRQAVAAAEVMYCSLCSDSNATSAFCGWCLEPCESAEEGHHHVPNCAEVDKQRERMKSFPLTDALTPFSELEQYWGGEKFVSQAPQGFCNVFCSYRNCRVFDLLTRVELRFFPVLHGLSSSVPRQGWGAQRSSIGFTKSDEFGNSAATFWGSARM